jgi:hypothetical protein
MLAKQNYSQLSTLPDFKFVNLHTINNYAQYG